MATPEPYNTEFEEMIFTARPESVLDIGCGEGAFVRRALERGIRAAGVDPNSERVAACRAASLDVREASAESLPFPDANFAWAVCARSAHHFADLAAGLAEAARVAQRGIFIFDPWFDETIPSQAAAAAIERWEKRVSMASGHVNNGPLSANDFLRALPKGREHTVEIAHRLNLTSVTLEELATETEHALEHGGGSAALRAERDALLFNARATGCTKAGAIFVVVRF